MDAMMHHDPSDARSLPDEYARMRVRSGARVLELVGRRWGDRAEGERRELAQILLMILEPLNHPGGKVTEELRIACEQAVADWVRNTIPVGELLDSAASDRPDSATPMAEPVRPRVVRLVSAEVNAAADENGRGTALVTLERSTRRFAVAASCRTDTPGQLRGGAEAALEALRQAIAASALSLELRDVGTFEAFGRLGVIVSVSVTEAEQQATVVGVCPDVGDAPVRAAALAVLNATNRRLGIG